jgi:hypothetical protein
MYCVVRANSTTGLWIVERTTKERMRCSRANIALVTPRKREAEREARRLNRAEQS